MAKKMTDQRLMKDPLIDQIETHLNEAGRLLEELRKKSGRRLSFFGEDGGLYLIDDDADVAAMDAGRPRARPVDQGGSIVRKFENAGTLWSGGGF